MNDDEQFKFANFDNKQSDEETGFTLTGDILYGDSILEVELVCPFAGHMTVYSQDGKINTRLIGLAVKSAKVTGVRYDGFKSSSSDLVPRITSSLLELAAIKGYNATHPQGPDWTKRDESKKHVYRMVSAGAINTVFEKGVMFDLTSAKRFARIIRALTAWRRNGKLSSQLDPVVAQFDKLGRRDFALVDVIMDLEEK